MTKKRWLPLVAALSLVLGGCASTSEDTSTTGVLPLVMPQQPDQQVEIALAKLSELLQVPDLSDEQRARFLYDRAIRYDSVGLRTLARIDFTRALQLQPDLPDVYNFMGIYYTQAQEFDQAYEAFDAVLELDPAYSYAYLNRGIALYYGGRPQLAVSDLETFYLDDQRDPYRVIWLYLAELNTDPEGAQARLRYNRTQLDDADWATGLVDLYLGRIEPAALLAGSRAGIDNQRALAERLCEAYFYLGKKARMEGRPQEAINLYKLALATNIYEFVEHRYALVEMREIAEDAIQQAEAANSAAE
ncbi:lipoprotein NlpI [Ferrimonas balearica]|uniref:lipoprotein NlpI n=1 Tax=Ferrimonas balearica TaxID=44012 RepID=UPI001C5987EE|nr:lipoprotein NlpI [Ferrimonas balearica]MBW3139934.1 lipoprotein NlpI [Ferrimonas balearica]MBW3164958.1 lipoprotein NlpI [Ferrimonas balearica]MBY6106958.1 lipoprotein NlpI [Ferrimonas balearica]